MTFCPIATQIPTDDDPIHAFLREVCLRLMNVSNNPLNCQQANQLHDIIYKMVEGMKEMKNIESKTLAAQSHGGSKRIAF